jgi:hypothetical protein
MTETHPLAPTPLRDIGQERRELARNLAYLILRKIRRDEAKRLSFLQQNPPPENPR